MSTLIMLAGLGLLGAGIITAIQGNQIVRAQRPTQILYSDAARIPPGALMAGQRRIGPNRTDFIGRNGVVYVGYFRDGGIPSSTKEKAGYP